MSKRLAELMNKVVLSEGMKGKARLSLVAGKSMAMIDRYRKLKCKPSTDVARKLALECGCGDREADELALECSSEAKRAG